MITTRQSDIPLVPDATSCDLLRGDSAEASGVVTHEEPRPNDAGEAEFDPDLSVLLVGLLPGLLPLK